MLSSAKKEQSGALSKKDFEETLRKDPLPTENFSQKSFEKRLTSYLELCKDLERDHRMLNKILIDIRSVIKHDDTARELIMSCLGYMSEVLLAAIKDKRSAVQHEGVYTVSLVVRTFGYDVIKFAIEALAVLIPYSQNSIRVVSSGAIFAATVICESIQSPKVVNTLGDFIISKARQVRAAVMELLRTCAEHWPDEALRRCAPKIRELTDAGNSDAGPTAREATRDTLTILSRKLPDIFQPPQLARSVSRTNNFYGSRAATDLNSRVLSAKRNVIVDSARLPLRSKGMMGSATPAAAMMRSRTPTATASRTTSQPGSRAGSPTRNAPGGLVSVIPTPTRSVANSAATPMRLNFNNVHTATMSTPTRTNHHHAIGLTSAIPTPNRHNNGGGIQSPGRIPTAINGAASLGLNGTRTNSNGFSPQLKTSIIRPQSLEDLVETAASTTADVKARITALHSLREFIASHSTIVTTKCAMLVNRLIDVQLAEPKATELALVKAIEECTTAIARTVDAKVLLPILKNIIRAPDQFERKCAAAVKILTCLVHQQSEADARELVEGVVPLVFQVYERGVESAVRRDCVICLVVFANKLSIDDIRPYITSAMEKLVLVYGNRQQMQVWR